mgnify:CR=1 FL=1
MGWLFFEKPDNIKAYFDDQITSEERRTRVLDSAIVAMREYYAAVEQFDTDGNRFVTACVCLLRFVPNARDGMNFGYKDMSEFAGPCQTRAPERILRLLTDLTPQRDPHGYAAAWRDACWEKIKQNKSRPPLRHGTKIRIHNPPTFHGVLLDEVEVRRQGRGKPRFYHPQIGTFGWPWIRQCQYELA